MRFKTKAYQSVKNSPSLRTTIPQVVAEALAFGDGDEVAWDLDPKTGKVAVVNLGKPNGDKVSEVSKQEQRKK